MDTKYISKDDFIGGCRIHISYLITMLLKEIGFKRKLRKGKKNNPHILSSTEPYQPLVNKAASLMHRRPNIDIQDAKAMIPSLGQPVRLLRGETWKDVRRNADRIIREVEAEAEAKKTTA